MGIVAVMQLCMAGTAGGTAGRSLKCCVLFLFLMHSGPWWHEILKVFARVQSTESVAIGV